MGKWSHEARLRVSLKRQSKGSPPGYGLAFRQARELARLTIHEAAERSGVSVSQISYYETGEREPTLRSAQRLARAYGVSLDSLAMENETSKRG